MAIAFYHQQQILKIMTTSTRLWELSDDIQKLESAIALIQENETLSDEDRETKLEETFNQWLYQFSKVMRDLVR
jgi:hypothetical protein